MTGFDDDAIIRTHRLVLRPLRADDAEEMVVVLGDPALHEFIGGQPATLDELRARYSSWVDGSGSDDELWLNWIVSLAPDGAAVGAVQATIENPGTSTAEAAVAWTIGSPWQGHGYAGEAAAGLVQWMVARGINAVVAYVHPDHAASRGVAARAGLSPTSEVVDGEVVWRSQSV